MNPLQQALAEADENYFIGISNKGIYKRACKDLENADVSVKNQEDTAEIQISGETCIIKNPLWESSCSCPSRSVCRHLISAMLWLKNHIHSEEEEEEPEFFEESPQQLPDLLKQELSAVTSIQIRKSIGSQMKAILPYISEIQLEESSILSGTLPDGTAVRILYPLQNATCSCHKKDLCVHKAAVILAWQIKEGITQLSDFDLQTKALSDQESHAIQASAQRSYTLLCDILKWGFVRMPENMAEHLEAAAVQSHALRMADAEKMLRELSGRLSDCRERRAVFHTDDFLMKLCTCAEYLYTLQNETLSEEMLGEFRRNYEKINQDLTIIPVGHRKVNSHEYQGDIYYFLNPEDASFLTFSDIRPVFYHTNHFHRKESVIPWNAGAPIESLMQSKMILRNAKISDGKLSGSQETEILMTTPVNLNCKEICNLIYTDFRKLAIDLAKRHTENERLYFVHPSACISSTFDTHSQKYQMQIADHSGNQIRIQIRYQAETKEFIQFMEHIGDTMLKHPEKIYTWFCSAYFDDGKLVLFPLGIYDSIEIPQQTDFFLPAEYTRQNPAHAEKILQLLKEIENYLCEILQSGLQSYDQKNSQNLCQQAKFSGMQGLSDLLNAFAESAEHVRHSMQEDLTAVMQNYITLTNYLKIGLEKLDVFCALTNMNTCDKIES